MQSGSFWERDQAGLGLLLLFFLSDVAQFSTENRDSDPLRW
jgi:hypothetical protein